MYASLLHRVTEAVAIPSQTVLADRARASFESGSATRVPLRQSSPRIGLPLPGRRCGSGSATSSAVGGPGDGAPQAPSQNRVASVQRARSGGSSVSFSPLLDLSYELSELADRDTYLHAAPVSLSGLLPGDDTFWLETDFAGGSASARHGESGALDPTLGGLLSSAYDHPAIRSYLRDPDDLSPRRLSDVTASLAWRNSHAYELLSGPMGRHQLSLIVRLRPPSQGNGWTIGRTSQDFSDAELAVAGSVLPLLTTLDRLYDRSSQPTGPAAHESLERAGLTPREGEMLILLAEGFTAEAIGQLRRISSGTVRKHLEHVYSKLGCHDRLMAVQEARRRGILPL